MLTNHNSKNTYFQNKTVITVIVITVILFQIIPHFPCSFRKSLRYGFEKMRVVFLQLPLFEKKELECMDIFDCWIYVLNNMEQM